MKEIKPLMVITILCVSSMMAFLAVVGPIIRKLGLQEWHAGLMVALAGVAWIFLSRFWGKRSDIYGRKYILLLAVFGFFISYLLLAIYPPAERLANFIPFSSIAFEKSSYDNEFSPNKFFNSSSIFYSFLR